MGIKTNLIMMIYHKKAVQGVALDSFFICFRALKPYPAEILEFSAEACTSL